MNTKHFLAGLSLATGCVYALPVCADVEFNGFGQIAVGSTLGNDHSAFPNLNYSADPSFTPETLFALQVRAPLTGNLAATAQIVASGAQGADFTPKFQWAYVSYQLSDAWSVKLGRQVDPIYKYSDYAAVGQAYNWLRPPPVVYQGINNLDGVSLAGYYEFGDWNFQPQLVYGNLDTSLIENGQSDSFDFKNEGVANAVIGYEDWLSFRLGAAYTNLTLHNAQLDSAVAAVGDSCQIIGTIPGTGTGPTNPPVPTCTDPAQSVTAPIPVNNSAVVSELQTINKNTVFYSAGLEIDKYNVKLISEYITSRFINSNLLSNERAYYVSLGYEIGRVTPMLTFGHSDLASSAPGAAGQVNNGAGLAGVPVAAEGSYVVAIPTALYVSNLISTQRQLNDYYEFGVRWDTTAKTAIKLDFTRYLNRSGTYAGLEGPVDPYTGVNLLSAAFVFVF